MRNATRAALAIGLGLVGVVALVGQSVGARNRQRFRAAVWLTSIWAMVLGVICSAVIWFFGPTLIDLMTLSPDVQETARTYLPWAAIAPVLGVICFQFDGIFTGAVSSWYSVCLGCV